MTNPFLLQAAEATKAASDAAANVTHHAATDPFTALLWVLVLVFGAAVGILFYQKVIKEPAKGPDAADVAALRAEVAALSGALIERKRTADADRLQDKMKFEQDLAAIAHTLDKLVDTADKLTTITERTSWHSKELSRHDEQFKELHDDLKQLRRDISDLRREPPRT